jgi:hypothetical protein
MEPTEEPVDREVVFHDQGRGFDQPPNDSVGAEQGIRPHGIPSATQFGSLTIKIRTHLWISWTRIAIKHEATAHAVRQEMQQPGADQSDLLLQESDAGLDGICAAAFALEALSRELVPLGGIPKATVEKWRQQEDRPNAENVALEVLSQTFDTRGLYSSWRGELEWLFEMRDSSVHYEGLFEPPKLHPLGINAAPAQENYSAENVTRAINLLLGILERCRDKPKPPAKQWSEDMRGAVNELIGRRGQAG